MGAHIHEFKNVLPLDIQLVKSAWRDTGLVSLKPGGLFSFFQDETADVNGWFDTPVRITHERNIVTVELPTQVLRVGGLDGSRRSIQKFLNMKEQRNLRGVRLWFTATETDTWHYQSEE